MKIFSINNSRNLVLGVIFLLLCCLVAPTFSQKKALDNSRNQNLKTKQSFLSDDNLKDTAENSSFLKGETANFKGNGFQPFENVSVFVEQIDFLQRRHNSLGNWSVFADDNGDISFNWQVPFEGKFIIKAVGSKTKQEAYSFVAVAPTPVNMGDNPSCADLNASTDPAFAHVTSDNGFKVDSGDLVRPTATYNFTNADGELTGGAPEEPNNSVTITFQNTTDGETFDWSATKSITAVLVKGGGNQSGTNAYPYNPPLSADTGLHAPDAPSGDYANVSHVEFCYNFAPTSAGATVGGKVTTAKGRGLSRAVVSMTDLAGNSRIALTNTFGYYRFSDVDAGSTYTVKVLTKNRSLSFNTQVVTVFEDMSEVNFAATSNSPVYPFFR